MTDSFNDRPGGISPSSTPENRYQQSASTSGTTEQKPDPVSDLKQKAGEDIRQVREFAEDKAHRALEATTEMAADQKNMIARKLGAVAEALEKVGAEMENGKEADLGRYARQFGSSARQIASDIKDRDMSEVVSMAEDYGRRQPLAFLGFAALAGFAASRFVTASTQRRSTAATTSASTAETGSMSSVNYGRYGGRSDV